MKNILKCRLLKYLLSKSSNSSSITATYKRMSEHFVVGIFLIFPRKRDLTLHEMPNPLFWEKNKIFFFFFFFFDMSTAEILTQSA